MQEDPTKTAPTGTQTLLRGLAVVQAVAAGARDLKDIAQHIGTTRSTTHRLVSCLVDERYLRVVPQVGYLLGPKLIEVGFQAREELPLVTLAGPYHAEQTWAQFEQRMVEYGAGGYAFDLEDNEPSIRCVAAPVRDASRRIVAAVSVASTVPYMPEEKMRELVPVVKGVTARLSAELGLKD